MKGPLEQPGGGRRGSWPGRCEERSLAGDCSALRARTESCYYHNVTYCAGCIFMLFVFSIIACLFVHSGSSINNRDSQTSAHQGHLGSWFNEQIPTQPHSGLLSICDNLRLCLFNLLWVRMQGVCGPNLRTTPKDNGMLKKKDGSLSARPMLMLTVGIKVVTSLEGIT